jgi:biopolymer transport protein ExbD
MTNLAIDLYIQYLVMNKKWIAKTYFKRKPPREAADPDVELSSIADVSFLLLIFFIVTSSFAINEGIIFNLPSKNSSAQKVDKKDILDVYPQPDGFLVANILMSREEFKDHMKKSMAENEKLIAVVHMKDAIKYERLVDTLSVIKENKMKKVSVKSE